MLKNLIPKIFYDHLQDGLDFFIDGLGFEVLYRDDDLAVIARDGAKAYIVRSPEYTFIHAACDGAHGLSHARKSPLTRALSFPYATVRIPQRGRYPERITD
ncbi:MAG: hypothetical protein WBW32_04090 [Luteibacter sp.]